MQEASRLVEEAEALEPNLVRPLRRFLARVGWEAERLRRKLLAAQAARDEVLARHLGRLKVHLLPFGLPQERVYPYAMYALRHGEALRRLADAPWEGRVALYLG